MAKLKKRFANADAAMEAGDYALALVLAGDKEPEIYAAALNESCAILDIPYLDANTFNTDGAYHGKWLFTDPFHLNDRGSEIIANLIAEMILKSPGP